MKSVRKQAQDRKPLLFGVAGGFIASLCCLGPVLLVGLGLSGVSFALSIGKYTWLFLTLGTIFLLTSMFFYYRKKQCCNTTSIKQHWKQILIAFVIMVGVLVIIKYWLATYLAQLVYGR